MLSTTLAGWLINASMAYVTDCAHASPQIFGLITRSRKLRSLSMSGRHRSALFSVRDHKSRRHLDPTVRHDTGVVATLSPHTSRSGPTATTLAGATLSQHD
jgi:hypothetical protein